MTGLTSEIAAARSWFSWWTGFHSRSISSCSSSGVTGAIRRLSIGRSWLPYVIRPITTLASTAAAILLLVHEIQG
jgi:hypothetical protein